MFANPAIINRNAIYPEYLVKNPTNIVYPREMYCRYSFYTCGRKRAVKRNGSLHTLCDKHRADANRNQRRLAQRRKEEHITRCEMQRAMFAKPTAPMVKVRVADPTVTSAANALVNGVRLSERGEPGAKDNYIQSSVFRKDDIKPQIDYAYQSQEQLPKINQLGNEDITWLGQTLWEEPPSQQSG